MNLLEAGALLFDMDGTMVDNMDFHIKTWLSFFATQGIEMEPETFYWQTSGKTNREILRAILGANLSEAEVMAYTEQKEVLYRELYRPHLQPLPGLLELLSQAQQKQIPLAVATSAMRDNAEFTLGGLGLESYFKAIMTAEDIKQGKPDPEIFLAAAARLGVAPERCIVFEDSLAGIEAARRAKMRIVVITTTLEMSKIPDIPEIIQIVPDFTSLL